MYDYLVFLRIIKIRKNDDDFSVQSIVYDYYNQIRINQKKIGENFLSKVLCLWLF